ncbi:1-acyl-sn-glycerol-3-phosphate acyltransferase [Sneathiella sp. CAU 1612]|uniref:1-acyl-sn-glycerol-3-phosphate acyltransferase n=1 Tax=Sneathiella sedimenti TaxID=2816034 RepID=A0ABS3F4P8_9PROT|nr:1-acyl-sn-glycerol-3-phosphate acyltransferase [Sneathiella sedimenti]
MTQLRSLAFFICFFAWSTVMNLAFLPFLPFDRKWIVLGQRIWSRGIVVLLRSICNLRLEIRGEEYLPSGAAIVAAKHQSAFETMIFHLITDDPAIILKKELLSIPVYGWYCRKTKMIAVDRKGHAAALKSMLAQAQHAMDDQRPIIIFPEGTRSPLDEDLPFQPGIAALYTKLQQPVVPVALNTGLFWPRRSFFCRPGVMVIEFLPPIEAGMDRKVFMKELKSRIETKTEALVAEGRTKYIS